MTAFAALFTESSKMMSSEIASVWIRAEEVVAAVDEEGTVAAEFEATERADAGLIENGFE